MTRTALEIQILNELHHLPLEMAEEALDFVMFLRTRVRETHSRPLPTRPLGLMKDKATCRIEEDFSITDEELLRL